MLARPVAVLIKFPPADKVKFADGAIVVVVPFILVVVLLTVSPVVPINKLVPFIDNPAVALIVES